MQSKQPEILLTIDENGETQIEVLNVSGKSCTELTDALETAIGHVQQRQFKPEHRQVQGVQTQRLKNRN
jgi:hypothetical protein